MDFFFFCFLQIYSKWRKAWSIGGRAEELRTGAHDLHDGVRCSLKWIVGGGERTSQSHGRGRGKSDLCSLVPALYVRESEGHMKGSVFGLDDVQKFRLKGSSTHQEAIHIRLACQILTVGPCHRASINDPGRL